MPTLTTEIATLTRLVAVHQALTRQDSHTALNLISEDMTRHTRLAWDALADHYDRRVHEGKQVERRFRDLEHDALASRRHPGGGLVVVHYDVEPENPRHWGSLGVMACHHSRYILGDHRHPLTDEVIEALKRAPVRVVTRWLRLVHGATVVLPLYLLDHSGLSMSAGSPSASDPGGWDTSMVGLIFDTPDKREEFGTALENIEAALRGEVETYSAWLEGMVYRYTAYGEDGEEVASCGGYYEEEDALTDGLAEIGAVVEPRESS